jgi:hypothetical protein
MSVFYNPQTVFNQQKEQYDLLVKEHAKQVDELFRPVVGQLVANVQEVMNNYPNTYTVSWYQDPDYYDDEDYSFRCGAIRGDWYLNGVATGEEDWIGDNQAHDIAKSLGFNFSEDDNEFTDDDRKAIRAIEHVFYQLSEEGYEKSLGGAHVIITKYSVTIESFGEGRY